MVTDVQHSASLNFLVKDCDYVGNLSGAAGAIQVVVVAAGIG